MRLHEVVDLATSGAPPDRNTIDEIVGKGRRVQRRRRAGFAGAGAALAVVAVTAAVTVPSIFGGTGQGTVVDAAAPSAGTPKTATAAWEFPADPFQFTFGAFDAGRWHVAAPVVASTSYQIASVYLDGRTTNDRAATDEEIARAGDKRGGPPEPTIYAYLVLYRPGAFNPAGLTGATELTVDGKQAYQVGDPGDGGMARRTLAWAYAPDAWAVLTTHSDSAEDPSDAELQKIVAGLKPSQAAPAKLPFTLDYVPAGYQPVELGSHAMSGLNGIAAARNGDYGGAIFANPAPPTTKLIEPYGGADGESLPGSFQIFVVPQQNSNQTTGNTTIKCGNGFCTHRSPDGKTSIQVASDGRLSDAEMTKILKGLKLKNVKDDSTWADAATALVK
ncbi:hypothetical protein [Actinoplanes derwentensis]|uniref:Uncharacterized protein n=1 Tax=Actinoplanes derwentensis TaxID=113562 RepID=A0A1H1UKW0_9ACTN|nr:hypothetical protein [Actinoplanes derwentensis]GID88094.1 hypothetical protein Ade03nite_70180 [Actinoplanes derwentensis]SDS73103.1 hypothetical protein SAMN04489716_1470 [Actinoplanes derwentensis]